MSTTDESVTDESTESIIAARPLMPKRPRLRFIDGAPDGGAGDPPADPDEDTGDLPANPDGSNEDPPNDPPADPDSGAKKALVAERKARKTAESELAQLKTELANKDKPAEEQALETARREGESAATAKANERILKTELKAAAKGQLADPSDALVYLNAADFEVGDDGEVDSDAINEAIADLIKKKPYLAAETGAKFTGSADQGAKGKTSKPAQLTQSDLDRMSPGQITDAKAKGLFNDLLGFTS